MPRALARTLSLAGLSFACLNLVAPAARAQLTITTADNWPLPIGRVEIVLTATGGAGALTWSLGACTLPPGVELRTDVPDGGWNQRTGLIGVAASPGGPYSCTVSVNDTVTTVTKTLVIRVFGLVATDPGELPDATPGSSYSQFLTATGGVSALAWTLQPGSSLPPGLSLDSITGRISGTPTTPGYWDIQYAVSDGVSTLAQTARITVAGLTIGTAPRLANATLGTPYSQPLALSGGTGTYYFRQGCCMPPGLSIDGTRIITGTPTSAGLWDLYFDFWDSGTSGARRHFSLGVVGNPPALPSLPTQMLLNDLTVGERSWLLLPVDGGTPPHSFSVSGTLPPGMSLLDPAANPPTAPSNGVVLSGTPTTVGSYTFTLTATDNSAAPRSVSRTYTLKVSPLTFIWVRNAQIGHPPPDAQIPGVGGVRPYQFAVLQGALPKGLSLSSSGAFSGTTLENGNFPLLLKMSDNAGNSVQRWVTLQVYSIPGENVFVGQTSPLPNALLNQPYNLQFTASGATGNYSWVIESGSLPPGLGISAGGLLSGTPNAAGHYTFALRATDASYWGSYGVREFKLQVASLNFATDANLGLANAGDVYSKSLSVSGATYPVGYAVVNNTVLPAGLTLSAAGVLGGTPAVTGAFSFDVQATENVTGYTAVRTFNLSIYPNGVFPPIVISTGDAVIPPGRQEIPLTASGGSGTGQMWALASGALPPGLAIRTDIPSGWTGSSAGLIGVARTPGTYTFSLRVTDGGGVTATKSITVKVVNFIATSGALPDGSVNVSYNHALTGYTPSGSLVFALVPGQSLPPGLNLASNGLISGTPTSAGGWGFNYTITNGTDTITAGAGITISNMNFSSVSVLPNITPGAAYSHTLAVTGATGSVTWNMDRCCLPNGLSLNPATGVISGATNDRGYWSIVVSAADSTGAVVRKTFNLGTVTSPVSLLSFPSTPQDDWPLGEMQQYRTLSVWGGTPPYNWSVISGELPPGVTLLLPDKYPHWTVGNGFLLSGAPFAAGTYTARIQVTDSSVPARTTFRDMTIRVSPLNADGLPPATYGAAFNHTLRVLGGNPPYTSTLAAGALPYGLTLSAGGVISGTLLETQPPWNQIRVVGSAGELLRNTWFGLSTNPPSSVWLDQGGEWSFGPNSFWSLGLSGGGAAGTLNYSVIAGSLPPGMSLSGSTISGTATATGKYTFVVKAADSANSLNFAARAITLNVTPLYSTVDLNLGWVNVGGGFSRALTVGGATGAVTWTALNGAESLPPGLSLTPGGILSGTALAPGDYNFAVRATDAAGNTNIWGASFSVYPVGSYPPLTINAGNQTVPIGRVAYGLGASGGNGVYTWSITSGTLPPGVVLRSDLPSGWTGVTAGLIGVATTPGTYNFTLRVADGAGNSATLPVVFRILNLVFTTHSQLPDATQGVSYSQAIAGRGSGEALTFAVEPGQVMPPGLTLAANGQITGTPSGLATGDYNFNVRLSEGSDSIVQNFRIYASKLNITTPVNLPNATQGVAYSQTISVTGGTPPYTLTSWYGNPGWLTWTPNATAGTVTLTGTPSGPGYHQLQLVVTDSTGAMARRNFALGVAGTPLTLPSIDTTSLEDWPLGEWRGFHVWISGGTPPYTWSVSSGNLPPGISILPQSASIPYWATPPLTLAGTPTATGSYNFAVTATDAAGKTVTRNLVLRISALSRDGLPDATYGVPYSQKLYTYGGAPPFTYSLNAGLLPAGLTLGADGVVSGTPVEAGNPWFQPRVTRGTDELIQGLNINVVKTPPTPVWINDGWDLGTILVNASWSRSFSAGGAAGFTWSQIGGTLPPGMSFSAAGVLTGTPTATGTYTFILRAANSANPAEVNARAFQLRVTAVNITGNWQLPFANVGAAYSQTLTATGGSISWAAAPSYALPPGLSLSAGGVLSGTPTSSGAYNFTVTATDSVTGTSMTWNYYLPVYPAGQFPPLAITTGADFGVVPIGPNQFELAATGGTGAYTWSHLGGTLPPGFTVRPDKPAWFSSQASAGLIGVATTPATYNFTLRVTSGAQTLDRAFTLKVSTITVKDSNAPDGFLGQAYSHTFNGLPAGTYTWGLTGGNQIPPGLSINSSTGELYGTPTTAGTYNPTITMSNGVDTVSRTVRLLVSAVRITTNGLLPNATQNIAYTPVAFASEGGTGTITWSMSGSLPSGMSFLSGVLSGTPTNSGTWTFSVTATDSQARYATKGFSLNVVGVPPVLPGITTSNEINDFSVGQARVQSFWMSGGTAPYTWAATGLPPGISLRPTGGVFTTSSPGGADLWGTPTQAGVYPVTLTVTDSANPPRSAVRTYQIRVSTISGDVSIPNGFRGEPYSASLRVIGGTLPYKRWEILDDKLPAGLSLNESTGVVSGTPLENISNGIQFRITDSGGATFIRTWSFPIGARTTTIGVTSDKNLTATQGQAYSTTLSASGVPNPYNWSVESSTPLPVWLTLSPAGVLSGTPAQAGVFKFLIRATDSLNPANYGIREFVFTSTPLVITSPAMPSWTNTGTPFDYTITYSGATGATFSVPTYSALPDGLTLNPATGRISGTPTAAGAHTFTVLVTDPATGTTRTLSYAVNFYPPGVRPPLYLALGPTIGPRTVGRIVQQLNATGGSGSYVYSYAPAATQIPGARVQNRSSGPLPTSFPTSTTGGLIGVIPAPGSYPTTIRVTDAADASQYLDVPVTVIVSPLYMHVYSNLPRAVLGQLYTYKFTASGGTGPLVWSAAPGSLPADWTLGSDGTLRGTPTSTGNLNFTVTVTDSTTPTPNTLTMTWQTQVSAFEITSPAVLTPATVNTSYSQTLLPSATGQTWSIYSGSTPSGISLSAAGVLSGTPTGTGTSVFTVQATKADGTWSRKVFTLRVDPASPAALSISTGAARSDATVGSQAAIALTATGGTPPYTWATESGSALPAGMYLTNAGETVGQETGTGVAYLRGNPAVAGAYTFTLRVTDSAASPASATRIFTWRVSPLTQEFTNLPISGTTLYYSQPYSQKLLGLGGNSVYTWTATAAMPPGLALSAAGEATGTPTNTGTFDVPVRLNDSGGGEYLVNVRFTINPGPGLSRLSLNSGPDLGTMTLGSTSYWDVAASGSPLTTPAYVYTALGALPPGCGLLYGAALPSGTGTSQAVVQCYPQTPGTYTFTLRAQDASGNFGVKSYALRVHADNIFTAASALAHATAGSPYFQNLLAFGPALTWSVAPGTTLPPGMNLSSTGVLSATSAPAAGSYSIAVNLTDGAGSVTSRTFTLRVSTLGITNPQILPQPVITSTPFSYQFTATGGSGGAKTWTRTSGSFPSGIVLDNSTGILSGQTTSTGNYNFVIRVAEGADYVDRRFTLFARNQYPAILTFAIASTQLADVSVGERVSLNLAPSGGVGPYTCAPVGSLPPGLALFTGDQLPADWARHSVMLGGMPSTPGTHNFTLRWTDAAGVSIERTFRLNVSPLSLITAPRNATLNTLYNQALTTAGAAGTVSYTVTAGVLPPGTMLIPAGLLSGTPTNPGSWTFTVKATDSAGPTLEKSVALVVNAATTYTVNITTSPLLSDLPLGQYLNVTLSATVMVPSGTTPPACCAFAVTGGSLPPGAVLQGNILRGQIRTEGTYSFTIRATDANGNVGDKIFTLRVVPIFTTVGITPLLQAQAGQAFSVPIIAMGPRPPYTFALAPGSVLPAGVSLSSSGVLSGTTSYVGNLSFAYTVTDSAGVSLLQSRSVNIRAAGRAAPLYFYSEDGVKFGGATLTATLGAAYSDQLFGWLPNYTSGPYAWTLVSGSLPPGLSVVSGPGLDGLLAGVPTALGTYNYRLRVTDAAGQSLEADFSTVVGPLNFTPNPMPPATVGVPYSIMPTPSGGVPPFNIDDSDSSTYPVGLADGPGGTVAGTPTFPGIYGGQLYVTDAAIPPSPRLVANYTFYVDSTLTPGRFLTVSPSAIEATYSTAETPPQIPINIGSGGVPVTFTAAVGGISGASLTVTSGTTPATSTLSLPAGLAVGTHGAVIRVTSLQSPGYLRVVRVKVSVTAPPPCSYSISPATATAGSGTDSGSLNVTAASYCSWTASSGAAWITVNAPAGGTGSGAVTYNVAANPNTTQRTGTITVNGQTHTVTQQGTTPVCLYSIDPGSVSLSSAGGAGQFAVGTSLANCAWTAQSNDSGWLHVTAGGSGTGNGSVSLTADPNPTGGTTSRPGSITLYEGSTPKATFAVSQAPAACILTLSSGNLDMTAAGGAGSVTVALPAGCSYASTPGAGWISITGGGSGIGPGGVLAFNVAANSSTSERAGSFLVGGQSFRINQAGVACSFSLSYDNPAFGSSGGSGSVGITANGSNCSWTASSGANWLPITAGQTGTGASGTVNFSVTANGATTPRSGALTVAGQTVNISQGGVACSYDLRSPNGTVPAAGGDGLVSVVAPSACSWSASSNAAWLTVNSGGSSGSGDVAFLAAANPNSTERSGTLTVAGKTYTVTQPGRPCAYVLGSPGTTVAASGASGQVGFTSTTGGCSPAAVSFASWLSATTSFNPGNSTGTVNFVAEANPTGSPRSGTLRLEDQVFTVSQLASGCTFALNTYGASYDRTGGSGTVLASESATGCPLAVGSSPEILLGPRAGPVSNIYTQPYTVMPYESFVTWVRLLHIDFSGTKFTVKQSSW